MNWESHTEEINCRALVAQPQTYNRNYSGGRDQEDHGRNPAWEEFSRPDLEKPTTKKGWWSGSRCRPEFKGLLQNNNNSKTNIMFKKLCLFTTCFKMSFLLLLLLVFFGSTRV
jgi:hypothetical protein